MKIQVNTDHNIEGGEKFSNYVNGVIENAMGNFRGQISHVGVHVSDQNSSKDGHNDKRCKIEARLIGKKATAVTHDASTVDEAVNGAVEKLSHLIEHALDRGHNRSHQPLEYIDG